VSARGRLARLAARALLAAWLACSVAAPALAQRALPAAALRAQSPVEASAPSASGSPIEAVAPRSADAPPPVIERPSGPLDDFSALFDERRMATAVEIAVVLTVLSLVPAILITVTSFTRIVIVLSFVRRALSTNELPPNPVIIGLSLFLTTFVMAPVASRIHERAWVPYRAGEVELAPAGEAAWQELRGFLVANTRASEIEMFSDLARLEPAARDAAALPVRVVVPAFVVSELKTSFQMGFLLFLPFLVIDLVVSSVLLSMGMFMLPPAMVSTPLKILLFVLVDGWHLLCESLVTSFVSV
jgi:flagellar biosynthetic protein FliP